MNTRRMQKSRRGVVLLIVVSLLALFILLGVTYSLTVSQYVTASKLDLKIQQVGDRPEVEADLIFGQVLHDTDIQARSSVTGHSLLADLYGIDGILAQVTGTPFTTIPSNPPMRGQFLVLQGTPVPTPGQQPYKVARSFSSVRDYYCGRVLTFTSGEFNGKSTRIVGYIPSVGVATFVVELPSHPSASKIGTVLPAANDEFLINGAPFNGTGFGYNASAGNLDKELQADPSNPSDWLTAFKNAYPGFTHPFYSALFPHFAGSGNRMTFGNAAAEGGMDEPYDTPDHQNMHLAMVPPGRATNNNLPILPSFHRPELVQYWEAQLSSPSVGFDRTNPAHFNNSQIKEFLRQIIFRPMPWDHPNFTGSNPQMQGAVAALANMMNPRGIWDVDNDGDGVADSIWIDPGLPIITAPDGRRIKRLAAILIKDLDGRININVHGNSQQWANSGQHRAPYPMVYPHLAGNNPMGPPPQVYLPRGLGFGPAEVDFQHLLYPGPLAGTTPAQIYQAGSIADLAYQFLVNGRYHNRLGTEFTPGIGNTDDPVSQDRNFLMPGSGQASNPGNHLQWNFTAWSSPPDVYGRGVIGLDYLGQPVYGFLGANETVDDPYEVQYDPVRAAHDTPYQPRELERLLRYHDPDSQSIDSRLLNTTPALQPWPLGNLTAGERPGEIGPTNYSHARRESITTMGSHIPVPPPFLARERRTFFTGYYFGTASPGTGVSILDEYSRQMGGSPSPASWLTIVPFELRHGELFNINRPFGNGKDDPMGMGNVVADDPAEMFLQETFGPGGTTLEKLNDDWPAYHPSYASGTLDPKQAFARQLYCLLMLLKNPNWNVSLDLNGNRTPGEPADTAHFLAQWAINVVDFRDADSIMTPFEFDLNPFVDDVSAGTTWNVDGWISRAPGPDGQLYTGDDVPSPDDTAGFRGIVWGVERPELLITETLAFHDRRTEDLGNEAQNPSDATDQPARTTDPGPSPRPDVDYDQRLQPRGSFFLELFNPWHDISGDQYDHKPAEIYSAVHNGGVRLNQLDQQTGTSPVWRVLIIRGQTHQDMSLVNSGGGGGGGPGGARLPLNPDHPRPGSIPAGDVDRSIYFVNPSGVVSQPGINHGIPFHCNLPPNAIAPLMPGRYAVVGSYHEPPASSMGPQNYTTYVGRESTVGGDTFDKTQTRRIILTPSANPNQSQVQVLDNYAAGQPDMNPANIQPPIAVPITHQGASLRTISVTEPTAGYPATVGSSTFDPAGANGEGAYTPPIDVPLDAQRTDLTDPMVTTEWNFLLGNYTKPNFRTVLLQRLANPLMPFDQHMNPYITIDRASVDVTAFNGAQVETDTHVQTIGGNTQHSFQTFQRGGSDPRAAWDNTTAGGPDVYRTLWSHTPPRDQDAATRSPAGGTPHYYNFQLLHTLGYLNVRYHDTTGTTPFIQTAGHPYRGSPIPGTLGSTLTSAFPWMTFNNRPYMSAGELLLVPVTNQYDLLARFALRPATAAVGANRTTPPLVGTYSEYGPTAPQVGMGPPPPQYSNFDQPYGRLLNFFVAPSSPVFPNSDAASPMLARLFDYVSVPSPYTWSDSYYNPQHVASANTTGLDNQYAQGFRPPFNKLSRFRDPGRINFNTIFDDPNSNYLILQAIFKGHPALDPGNTYSGFGSTTFADNLLLSRQGNGATAVANLYQASTSFPSMFCNPFRPQDFADLAPAIANLQRTPIDAGWLRSNQMTGGAYSPTVAPLLAYDAFASSAVQHDADDTNRNPYFRYQAYQKLANLISSQSNCYAIWITIGYFEVEDNTNTPKIDAAHPEGLAIAQEVGSDSGQVVRHRAFYIVDRSIPVGFMPGSRLNTDDCVLVRRLIE